MNRIFRIKPVEQLIDEAQGERSLKKVLGTFDLTMLGIGAIVGTGIFVITGIAAAKFSGPALILSFIISGFACTFAALCYAEFASIVPVAGSAYTYSYAALGEIWAWIIGWDLILEYTVATGSVAIGWSGYANQLLQNLGINLPKSLVNSPFTGGIINLPAVLIIALICTLLILGVRQSTVFNNAIVIIKLAVILLFIILAVGHVKPVNWHPFMPFGWGGVFRGAAYIFFAYIGFDAVSTAAEEVKNPQKQLPRGIILSLLICTALYIIVSAILTGVVPYFKFSSTSAPVAYALQQIGIGWGSALVSVGAICGITSVLLVMLFGQTRIFFAMSRDGLLPGVFGAINKKTQTPVTITIIVGIVTAAIVLRYKRPDIKRPFKCPFVPVTPLISAAACLYLIFQLTGLTKLRFVVWFVLGLVVYFSYSQWHSTQREKKEKGE